MKRRQLPSSAEPIRSACGMRCGDGGTRTACDLGQIDCLFRRCVWLQVPVDDEFEQAHPIRLDGSMTAHATDRLPSVIRGGADCDTSPQLLPTFQKEAGAVTPAEMQMKMPGSGSAPAMK